MAKRLLVLLVAFWTFPVFGVEPTTGPLAGTTAAHNLVRQNLNNGVAPVAGAAVQPVPVPPLPDFAWDDTVAASAQAWADGCTLGHETGSPYGENLAIAGAGFGLTGSGSASSWASEVNTPYDYATNQCPIGSTSFPTCGHYTAVVWSTTTKVGCGFKTCGGSEWIVCRYDPPGNFDPNNNRPYCTATQTTGCQMGAGGGGGNSCAAATELVCGTAANGTSVGASNDFGGYPGTCPPGITGDPQAGADVVYSLAPPESGTITVDLAPDAADLDLFVLGTCDSNDCAAGSEEIGNTVAEQVTFAATAGQTYYVIVEDYNSAGDTFTLTATCPCTAPDGINQDLATDTVTITKTVHVCGTITTAVPYTVGMTGKLTLRAPSGAIFRNDFSVLPGGELTVRND